MDLRYLSYGSHHHCLANHQAQASHHFLVDHQAQVRHQYAIITVVLCVLILQLLEESNNLLIAETHAEAETLIEALGEVLTEELVEALVEALGEVLALAEKLEEALDIDGVSSQQPDQPRVVKASISTGRQKRTKTKGFDIFTNASGSQSFNVSVYIILFISYSTI